MYYTNNCKTTNTNGDRGTQCVYIVRADRLLCISRYVCTVKESIQVTIYLDRVFDIVEGLIEIWLFSFEKFLAYVHLQWLKMVMSVPAVYSTSITKSIDSEHY